MTLLADVLQRLLPARAPETKRSATARLVRVEMLGEPVWSPRDYGAFAREGFMQNAICYRCVRMIAEAAASIPLLLYERGGFEIEDHPFLDLLRCPSHDQTGTDFLESWYGFLLVAGNAYVEAVALDGAIRELHALRPDRMKVVPGPDGWPQAYEYSADGQSVTFAREPVPGVRPILHMRLFHPVNDHYGLSPIEAAATAIDIHNAASGWNKALLDNAARPSGALVYGKAGEHMTPSQFERLKEELETSFQGAKNAGRPLLLEGGLDWKPLSLTPKDMDFIEARNMAAREIALALGVPPMLLGIPGDNTYSNYQEAQRAFWRQTVLPLVTRTCRSLSAWLSPAFLPLSASGGGGGGLELKPNLDRVDALSSERDALWTRLEKATFLTANEKRTEAGYDPITGGDELKFRADRLASKFNPGQPRVPAGNPDGGQWTNGDGAQNVGDGRVGAPYGTAPDGMPVNPAQARAPGQPIDLRDEDGLGGHTFSEHISVNPEYLRERVRLQAEETIQRGDDFRGLAIGSFTSLQAANKLVNSTISEGVDSVHGVVSGLNSMAVLNKQFDSVTGYEAFLPGYHALPYKRDTYSVRVVIVRDTMSSKGYRVQSAFPVR